MKDTYSSEDVQQILMIALGRESSSVYQLREMARELSIDDDALRYAVDVWAGQKAKVQKQQQLRQRFYQQALLPYVTVNAFLIVLNVSIAGSVTWAIYPLLGWGAGLLLQSMTGGSFGPCQHGRENRQFADSQKSVRDRKSVV